MSGYHLTTLQIYEILIYGLVVCSTSQRCAMIQAWSLSMFKTGLHVTSILVWQPIHSSPSSPSRYTQDDVIVLESSW